MRSGNNFTVRGMPAYRLYLAGMNGALVPTNGEWENVPRRNQGYLPTGQATKYYLFNGRRIAKREGSGPLTYFYHDHLGSASLATDAQGVALPGSATRYYPYGGVRTGGTALPTDYRFTGQRRDNAMNLDWFQSRWYDAHLGMFTQPDTIIPNLGNPQSLNRYAYSYNNPLNYTDPTGHIPCYGDGPTECSWAGYADQPAGARRHSLRGYARFLEKQMQNEGMTALDAMIDLWGFAGLYGKDGTTTANDVSYTLVGSGGTMTLFNGFVLKGKEFLGGPPLNLPNFGDSGFNPNYQDGHNQPYHFWANVNTTAQGGSWGEGIGAFANIVHEMLDPSEALKSPEERGTSWEDYYLSLKGMQLGLKLHSGELTVDQAGGWMRSTLSAPAGPLYNTYKSLGTSWWPSVWMQKTVDFFR